MSGRALLALSAVLAAGLIAVGLSGCGGGGRSKAEQVIHLLAEDNGIHHNLRGNVVQFDDGSSLLIAFGSATTTECFELPVISDDVLTGDSWPVQGRPHSATLVIAIDHAGCTPGLGWGGLLNGTAHENARPIR
jgi:hypothetical protein